LITDLVTVAHEGTQTHSFKQNISNGDC